MKARGLLRFGWVGLLAVAGVFGVAYAQETGAGAPPSEGTASADMKRDVQLPPEEMEREGEKILAGMDGSGKAVGKMLAEARKNQDVVKALCLDDKFSQINVTRRVAGERYVELRVTVKNQDKELATHHYTILLVHKEQVGTLAAEANQCIGVEAGFVGDTKVVVDIDPGIPEDPSEFPENPIILVPPVCMSCVQ